MKFIYNKMRLIEVQNETPIVQNSIGNEIEVSFNDLNILDYSCYLLFETPVGEISPRLVMTRNNNSFKIILTDQWFTAFYGKAKISFLLKKSTLELITTSYPIAILEAVSETEETHITLDEYNQLNETINQVDVKATNNTLKFKDYYNKNEVDTLFTKKSETKEIADNLSEVNVKVNDFQNRLEIVETKKADKQSLGETQTIVSRHGVRLDVLETDKADKTEVESIKKDLVSVYKFRGSFMIDEFNNLSDKKVGDVFNIKEPFSVDVSGDKLVEGYDYPSGTNIALYDNGGIFIDVFSGVLNLENYYTKQEVDSRIKTYSAGEGISIENGVISLNIPNIEGVKF